MKGHLFLMNKTAELEALLFPSKAVMIVEKSITEEQLIFDGLNTKLQTDWKLCLQVKSGDLPMRYCLTTIAERLEHAIFRLPGLSEPLAILLIVSRGCDVRGEAMS